MPKRKEIGASASGNAADDSGSEDDFEVLNVDVEWFNFSSDIDYHGVKSLLAQLFDLDAHMIDLSALTELILSQSTLGSTVKVDGKETDAYAFLSIINLQEHKDKPAVQTLAHYLRSKSHSNPALKQLSALLDQSPIPAIGLILTERLINVPSEVVPPMYTMLMEEIQWALEAKEPYQFSHYLILSKTYVEVASTLDQEDEPPKKKNKAAGVVETLYFHPEDEVLGRHALCSGGYDYTTPRDEGQSDSKRAFQELGIKPSGHAILIEASHFETAVNAVSAYMSQPG